MSAQAVEAILKDIAPDLANLVGPEYVRDIAVRATTTSQQPPQRVPGGYDFDISDVLQTLANLATVVSLALEITKRLPKGNAPTASAIELAVRQEVPAKVIDQLPPDLVSKASRASINYEF